MGADLIVYIAKGPAKFKTADVKKAVKKTQAIIDYAKKVHAVYVKHSDDVPLTAEEQALFEEATNEAAKKNLLAEYMDQEQLDNLDEMDVEQFTKLTGERVVGEFVDWWTHMSGRDTSGRIDPNNKRQQIVVCGDMSWGDVPSGEGYCQMQRAYWFGIPKVLGIR
jgi:hypothetical protein